MATWIKDLLPPLLYNRLTQKRPTRKLFTSYEDALRECPNDAYEEDELIRVILEKTKIYSNQLSSKKVISYDFRSVNMIAGLLMAKKDSAVNVLDFGGACGAHYLEARKGLPEDIKLNWVVVETPTMVAYGRQLETNELSFEDNLQSAQEKLGHIDFIYISGTIQCVDNPIDYLNALINLDAQYILFNRLGLTLGSTDIIVIHESMLSWNGIGPLPKGFSDRWIKYPFQFIQKDKFAELMNTEYNALFDFEERSGVFPVNNEKLEGKGILYEKNRMILKQAC